MDKRLTKKQKALLKDLREIAQIIGQDYYNILSYETDARTATLELMRDQMIRGEIIMSYTVIDEFLNFAIRTYFFGRKRSFKTLEKNKRFQIFNQYIIEELYLLPKLRLVKTIRKMPKSIIRNIEALNTLRNSVAHSFFPEDLRKAKPLWKGKNIFSLEGIKVFRDDMDTLSSYFLGDLRQNSQPKPSDSAAESQ